MSSGGHIAIEGPIGAGKTTLARILAQEFDAVLCLENPGENPFLEEFYGDRKRWALQAQLVFLLNRHRQQVELRQADLFHKYIICDYIFEKDDIFARLNLDEREYNLYKRIGDQLVLDVASPGMVIFLKTSSARLKMNIRIRDIPYERGIDDDYIQRLCAMYNKFFSNWRKCPVLTVRTHEVDFVNNDGHRRTLIDQVKSLHQGKISFSRES